MSNGNGGIRIAGATLRRPRHVCAFFNSQEEQFDALLPFMREGIDRGEKSFHVIDPARRHEHLGRLEVAGLPVDAAQSRGQLEVRGWEEAYLRGGHFNQQAMLSLIQEVLTDATQQGFPLTRFVANMEWALEDRPGVDAIVEYETRLNYVLPKYEDAVICTYDCAKFGAGVALDILRTHPVVIIGGLLQENPLYVPPDEFLDELRARGGSSSSR